MILEACWNSESINKNFAERKKDSQRIDDRRTSKRHVLCGIVVNAVVARFVFVAMVLIGFCFLIVCIGCRHPIECKDLSLSRPVSFCSKMAF